MRKTEQPISESFIYPLTNNESEVWEKILHIGGENGWYYGTGLWKLRGKIDELFGGIGYRKGRKQSEALQVGDQIDFWRIIKVDRETKKLVLQAEMSLPGKVLLEWRVAENQLIQQIIFSPAGFKGKAYWYLVKPFHNWVFFRMGKEISKG